MIGASANIASCDEGLTVPNPFPGMDPYLEGDLWTTVHTNLCEEIARQLAPKIRPKYVILSERRVVLAPPDEAGSNGNDRYPDVGIVTSHDPSKQAPGAVATAPLTLRVHLPAPIPHVSLRIRDVKDRRLVTCIEVLSPTNKSGSGKEEYEGRRFQILSSTAHLLEIDFLRKGSRFPAVALPPAPYFVFLSRAERRKEVDVWAIALEGPLPAVKVPLLPGDPDVDLDLQSALTTIYDIFGYDELIDYSQPPPGPLTAAQTRWIDEQLKKAGRRSA